MSATRWRLLDTDHATPAWNMALDEALLEAFEGTPVLRLYAWRPEALSLGRFQPLAEVAHVSASLLRVRRLTGGGAIHHREDEVTYSLVAPYAAFGGRGSPKVAYRAVHEAIASGLEQLGLALRGGASGPGAAPDGPAAALCYDRATDFDLKAGARKLVGSAQRRKGAAFLQHGSIPLSKDPFSPGATSLDALLGRTPSRDEVKRAVREGFAGAFSISFEPSAPDPREADLARSLEASRYSTQAWTTERL